jgi:hypothetical protein
VSRKAWRIVWATRQVARRRRVSSKGRIIALVVLTVLALVSSARTSNEQQKSCEVVAQALGDYSKLTVGMKRSEVEKTFQMSGGMNWRQATLYEYQKCEYIHVDIEFEVDSKSGNDVSPNDVVTKIGQLYLRYPVRD